LDPSSASCGILKRELEVDSILLSIVAAGLITCRYYFLLANIYRNVDKNAEAEAEVSGGGGGGKQRQRWR
jgi:hypothetical protein